MAEIWKSFPYNVPVDGSTVWVRRFLLDHPFQATWSLASQEFTEVSGLVLPWWQCIRWRNL